jgi:putative glutamine amidotransferase
MRACWDADVPVLGICRGMQVMNVTLGGTLVRDISDYPTKTIVHSRLDQPDTPVHHVRIAETSRLSKILGFTSGEVNSLHHEAICKQAPQGHVVAWAEDGTPEGLEFSEKTFFLGVQWHPEKLRTQPQLFSAFIDAAREHGAAKRAAEEPSL